MQIHIKKLDGQKEEFSLEPNDSVMKVKEMLAEKTGVHKDQIRLIFKGKPMNDEKTLGDQQVTDGSTLDMCPSDGAAASPTSDHIGSSSVLVSSSESVPTPPVPHDWWEALKESMRVEKESMRAEFKESMRVMVAQLKKEMQVEAGDTIAEQKAIIDQLRKDLRNSEDQIRKLTSTINHLSESHEPMRIEVAQLNESMRKASKTIASQHEIINSLTVQIEQLTFSNQELREEVKEIRCSMTDYETDVVDLTEANNLLQLRYAEATQELRAIKNQSEQASIVNLSQFQSHMEQLQIRLDRVTQLMSELYNQNRLELEKNQIKRAQELQEASSQEELLHRLKSTQVELMAFQHQVESQKAEIEKHKANGGCKIQ